MRRLMATASVLVALAAWPSGAGASGDGGCYATWTLKVPNLDCADRIVLGPGNDTRTNLLLLEYDRAGLNGRGVSLRPADVVDAYGNYDYGRTFFDWDLLAATLYPQDRGKSSDPIDASDELGGSRCWTAKSGGDEFMAAVARNKAIGEMDRATLAAGRAALLALCHDDKREQAGVPAAVANLAQASSLTAPEAREFGVYIAGAGAFYAGKWQQAQFHFSALRTARDEWVRETALYMAARTELNASSSAPAATDQWGNFDPAKADKAAAQWAERNLDAYLKAYPKGRYANSATGLVRRARWLSGNVAMQRAAYTSALAAVSPKDGETADLIDEIDTKFLFNPGAGQGLSDPALLATFDLMRMRRGDVDPDRPEIDDGESSGRHGLPALTADELARQQATFAGHDALYGFLQANLAFYAAHDYRTVLRLLPDDAHKPSYTPLQFSRQVLRGLALAELHDRNEAGFWQELLGGANGLYQRPTVELALALAWERANLVANAFAARSPVADPRIRSILLQYSAGPELLRTVATRSGHTQLERDTALFTLLFKELTRGSYAAAGQDLPLVRADAKTDGILWQGLSDPVPLGLFVKGLVSDGYACPPLRESVAQLARNPREAKGLLCLGDFYRLNGFDNFSLDGGRKDELGGFAAYPGSPTPRSRFYSDILADTAPRTMTAPTRSIARSSATRRRAATVAAARMWRRHSARRGSNG